MWTKGMELYAADGSGPWREDGRDCLRLWNVWIAEAVSGYRSSYVMGFWLDE